jgi:hypothetical protein
MRSSGGKRETSEPPMLYSKSISVEKGPSRGFLTIVDVVRASISSFSMARNIWQCRFALTGSDEFLESWASADPSIYQGAHLGKRLSTPPFSYYSPFRVLLINSIPERRKTSFGEIDEPLVPRLSDRICFLSRTHAAFWGRIIGPSLGPSSSIFNTSS